MIDVAPELLEKIRAEFEKKYNQNSTIQEVLKRVQKGEGTYKEANEFAIEVGRILAESFQHNLSSSVLPDGKMYYNIAKRVIEPSMKTNYELVSTVAQHVQQSLNKKANIGIKAIKPDLKQDKIDGIVNRVSNAENYDDVAWITDEPVQTFTQSVVDDTVKTNAEFHYKSGMKPKIIRHVAGNCCDWCQQVEGSYSYPNVPKDVYRRHQRCRCTVDYYPGNGKVQNVHSKQWQTQEERDKIEMRKIQSLIAEDDKLISNIRNNVIPKQKIDKVVKRQNVHRINTKEYLDRQVILNKKNQFGPSYITISDEEILELVRKYTGKGKIKYTRNMEWDYQECILTNDKIVGVVVDNRNGNKAETSVFKIHYSKDGVHIVPDYPSKKR